LSHIHSTAQTFLHISNCACPCHYNCYILIYLSTDNIPNTQTTHMLSDSYKFSLSASTLLCMWSTLVQCGLH